MDKKEYSQLLINTLKDTSNDEDRKMIISKLKGNKIIYSNKHKKSDDALDCIGFDNLSTLKRSIESNDITFKMIEDYEYEKPYKYSAIFEYNKFDAKKIEELIGKNKIKIYREDAYSHKAYDSIEPVINIPTYKEEDNKATFKFSLVMKNNRIDDVEKLSIKYNVLAIIYTNLNVLEIRFDNLADKYKYNKYFYLNQIKATTQWLSINLGLEISDINCRNIVENIIKNCLDEVKVYSQYMKMLNQAKATLTVANDGNYILPILGDLKNLIEQNKSEFEKDECLTIKNLLNNFIKEIEDNCDLPRVTVCWYKKEKGFIIEFIHDYMNSSFSLIQHYGRSQHKEGMEYVTQFIIKNRTVDEGE